MSSFLFNNTFFISPKVHLFLVDVLFYCYVVFLFTNVSIYRLLGCFQCLAIMSKVAVNIHVFGEHMHPFLSCIHKGVELNWVTG